MPSHRCDKETEIAEMHTILKRLDSSWFGNGQKGYKTRLDEMFGMIFLIKYVFPGGMILSIALTLFLHFY